MSEHPIAAWASSLEDRLQLTSKPVGVRFWPAPAPSPSPEAARSVPGLRYCQGLMEARRGNTVRLESPNLSCPAAAGAFGFRPLPPALASGQALVGFGIAREAAVGNAMFQGMTRLEAGWLGALDLAPLSAFTALPDVVVVEDRVERLMWLLLAEVNRTGGARVVAGTAVLQATCVDATLIPLREQRLNFSFGCYGCREATDMEPGEAVVGFPGALLPALVLEVERLSQRAISRSRAKGPYAVLAGREKGPANPFEGDA